MLIQDENITIDDDLRIQLIDYGSAELIENGPFNTFYGTTEFCAPEVLEGNTYEGKAQDCWALGILLYTLIYRQNPFYTVDDILSKSIMPFEHDMSPDVTTVLAGLLTRNSKDRLTISQTLKQQWFIDLTPV